MRVSAQLDLPWFFGGAWAAEAGMRSSFGSMMDAAKGGSPSPSISRAEDVLIRRCWAALKASNIQRRLNALPDRLVRALELHFGTAVRLPAGLSPAAELTSEAHALASDSLYDALARATTDERMVVSEAANLLVDQAVRAYESVDLPEHGYGTFENPSRKMRIRYT